MGVLEVEEVEFLVIWSLVPLLGGAEGCCEDGSGGVNEEGAEGSGAGEDGGEVSGGIDDVALEVDKEEVGEERESVEGSLEDGRDEESRDSEEERRAEREFLSESSFKGRGFGRDLMMARYCEETFLALLI